MIIDDLNIILQYALDYKSGDSSSFLSLIKMINHINALRVIETRSRDEFESVNILLREINRYCVYHDIPRIDVLVKDVS